MAVLVVASDATSYLSGRPLVPPVIVNIYRTAWLPGLVFAFVVLAPVGEETLFRGFLYKGVAASKAGPLGAIVLSAVSWAILHLQYDWYGIASIAVAGSYLGFVRYRTGSLFLAMLLHAVQNTIGTIELVAQESWLK
jgi:membrane protease YdiL (CAAX protease family)